MDETGAYRSSRAAALSGIPERTIHHWADKRIVVPSVSLERLMLWSYADLMALRVVSWLRHGKPDVAASSMPRVKRALAMLREEGLRVWSSNAGARVLIDTRGEIIVRTERADFHEDQVVEPALLDLAAPFECFSGLVGPDLRQPRPHLRIVPGKLGGEPHVANTRLETRAVAALALRGFTVAQIAELYPFASRDALDDCLSLERQLDANVAKAAA